MSDMDKDWWKRVQPLNKGGAAKVTVTMINTEGGERMIYAGLYSQLVITGLLLHPAYVEAVSKGCNIEIKSVTNEDCDKAIEKMEFEASVTGENIAKWRAEE